MLKSLDTLIIGQNGYLAEYTVTEFENRGLADQLINPEQVNAELLAAAIYFEIEMWRINKRRTAFREHSKLERIAYKYVDYNKWYKFRNTSTGYFRLIRTLKKVPQYYPLDFTFLDGFVYLAPLVDYKKGDLFYNEDFGTSEVNLYHGKYSREDDYQEQPVELINYKVFAERYLKEIVKSKSGVLLRSKAYELMAVRAEVAEKNTNKRLLPRVKIVCLLGAYRNKFILEDLNTEK